MTSPEFFIHYEKVESAKLALQLYKDWDKLRSSEKIISALHTHTLTGYGRYLPLFNAFNAIAIFWKDGTLTKNHLLSFFEYEIKLILEDKYLMDKLRNDDSGRFIHLELMLNTLAKEYASEKRFREIMNSKSDDLGNPIE